jgi:hypothetical protein
MPSANSEAVFAPDDEGPGNKLSKVSYDGIIYFCDDVALSEPQPIRLT